MLVVIDNYDSFTYNLVQYLGELGQELRVFRNDAVTVSDLRALAPERILVSPGPCTPNEAGISVPLISELAGDIPLLGVCLGHQSVGAAFGCRIIRAYRNMPGKTSPIEHDGQSVFTGLPNPFEATRYHSLVIDPTSVPDFLQVSAWTAEGEIMGIRHTELLVEGVQLHPESILTLEGKSLLRNLLDRGTNGRR